MHDGGGGFYHDGGGFYQDGGGHYQDGGGHYQDGGGHYQDGGGHYQDGGGHYHDGGAHDMGMVGHDPGAHHHQGADGMYHEGGHHHGDRFDAASYANALGGHSQHHHSGGLLAQLLGLNQGHHQGLLARLLGLDTKHHYAHQTPPEVTQQGQFLWENLGRMFKHDLFNEFELTPGKLFLLLLAAMIGWLFVLYYTRRYEPQVNAFMGSNVAQVAAYENGQRLNQPNQKPVELPSNSLYSSQASPYTSPDKFYLSRLVAKQSGGFVASAALPRPATSGEPAHIEGSGASSIKTADGRIQTIVNR